jgi:hypothetical protein
MTRMTDDELYKMSEICGDDVTPGTGYVEQKISHVVDDFYSCYSSLIDFLRASESH